MTSRFEPRGRAPIASGLAVLLALAAIPSSAPAQVVADWSAVGCSLDADDADEDNVGVSFGRWYNVDLEESAKIQCQVPTGPGFDILDLDFLLVHTYDGAAGTSNANSVRIVSGDHSYSSQNTWSSCDDVYSGIDTGNFTPIVGTGCGGSDTRHGILVVTLPDRDSGEGYSRFFGYSTFLNSGTFPLPTSGEIWGGASACTLQHIGVDFRDVGITNGVFENGDVTNWATLNCAVPVVASSNGYEDDFTANDLDLVSAYVYDGDDSCRCRTSSMENEA